VRILSFGLTLDVSLQLLSLDGSNTSSKAAARRLKPIVEERREKMKDEMIGDFSWNFDRL
jgi:hypothetical protein